jgi:hypothetical protein
LASSRRRLAKAQAQLINPEKSLVATIRSEEASGSERSFRYAPLSRRRRRRRDRAASINKTVFALPVSRRIRDREHVKSVAKQPCLVCGWRPADAHHLRFAQSPALGRKVSDEFTVPLCRGHHREVHRCGDEAAWWEKIGIDPTTAARVLWLKTHPLPSTTGKLPNMAVIARADDG